MKRLLPILLSAAIAVTGTAVPVSAADTAITETETALSWLLQDGCLEVWGEGDMPNYDKEDNPHPFSDQNREVTSLKIEEGVTSIGEYAFCGCTGLNAVVLPKSVKRIGSGAFDDSSYFHKNAVFVIQNPDCEIAPDTEDAKTLGYVGTIFGYAGSKAEAYAKEHNIPFYLLDAPNATETDVTWSMNADGVLTIGGKGNMKNYDPSISDRSPFALPLVREIIIADGVTAIGSNAFAGCQNLTAVSIPDSVTFIAARAFFDCENLVSAELPEHLQYIGEDAFGYCEMLESVAISESVRYLMKGAFDSCYVLWDVTLPYHLQDAAYSAFQSTPFFETLPSPQILPPEDDTSLTTGKCGENLTWTLSADGTLTITGTGELSNVGIDWENPLGTEAVKHLVISDGVTSIGDKAFYNCSSLTSVEIPESVTSIGDKAFYNCSSLTSVEIPASVTSIGEYAFAWCSGLTSIAIPDGVTSIGNYAFYFCENLTAADIADSVTSIGDRAFSDCSSLTSIVIPEGVTSIGYEAFYHCKSLTSAVLPDSVTSIGIYAFQDCENLASVTLSENTPYDRKTFLGTPWWDAKVTQNQNACIIENGVLVCVPSDVEKFLFPENVTRIGNYAFEECDELTTVTIPDSVTSIGAHAFEGCDSLRTVVIPDSVTSIEEQAFSCCGSLTSVEIPDSVTSIETEVFYGCRGLTSVVIPDSVTSIGIQAFRYCSSLKTVELPDSVTSIGDSAFEACGGLTSVVIPDGVSSIGQRAFFCCDNLTSVVIPDSVTFMDEEAFADCENLTSVELPEHLQDAAYSAFMSTPFFETLPSPQILPPEDEYSDDEYSDDEYSDDEYLENDCIEDEYSDEEYLENDCIEDEDTQTDGTIHDHGKLKTADGITYVLADGEAFVLSCADAETVTIPASIDSVPVTRICDGAFDGCTALQSVTIPASAELPHVGDVELGDGLYTEVNGVKTLFENCTALKEVLLDGDSAQYISHDGVLYDKASNSLIFCPAAKTSIDFLTGVTAIGLHAMEGVQITELTLPNSVRSISLYAFAGSKLQKVVLPSGLKRLEYYVFGDCTDLTEVVLPISLTEIGCQAFFNCTSLREIEIPANLVQMFSYYDEDKWAEIGPFNVVYVDDSGEYDRTYYPNNPVLVIKCYEDTVAEHYAADSDIVFENIGKKPIIGDLNADTKVSIADAVVLGRIINEDAPESYDETVFKYADLNYDGMYTVTDLLMLMKKLRK